MLKAEVIGDREQKIFRVMPLARAERGDLSFFAPKSKRQQQQIYSEAKASGASAVLVREYDTNIPCTQVITSDPLAAAMRLAQLFAGQAAVHAGVHPQASVDPSAKLGSGVSVGAFAVVANDVVIGEGTIIHPHAVIYSGASIGKNCVIHAGAVIREFVTLGDDCLIQNGVVLGGDGFGYVPDKVLGHRRIPHFGTLVLASGVDVGANATIDRAMLGEARVGKATKIDNLVMVGHNCDIGERVLLCGQVGVSGSVTIGDDVILAGDVGVADHVRIGSNVRAAAKAGITADVPPGVDIAGHPEVDAGQWRRQSLLIKRLPEVFRKVRELDKLLPAQREKPPSSTSQE